MVWEIFINLEYLANGSINNRLMNEIYMYFQATWLGKLVYFKIHVA